LGLFGSFGLAEKKVRNPSKEGDMGSNLQNSFDSPQAPTAHTFTFSGAVCGAGIAKFLDNLSGVLLTSYKIGLHEIHFEG